MDTVGTAAVSVRLLERFLPLDSKNKRKENVGRIMEPLREGLMFII